MEFCTNHPYRMARWESHDGGLKLCGECNWGLGHTLGKKHRLLMKKIEYGKNESMLLRIPEPLMKRIRGYTRERGAKVSVMIRYWIETGLEKSELEKESNA